MTTTPRIQRMTHAGLYVNDIEKSRRFYQDVLGLTETDNDSNAGLVFLSSNPADEHHMVVLIAGRTAHADAKLIQQIAFRCDTLADVIGYWKRFVAREVPIIYTITHGNAISCYFRDPDSNVLEVYWATGLDARQGFLVELDFSQPEEVVLEATRSAVEKYGQTGYVDLAVLQRQL